MLESLRNTYETLGAKDERLVDIVIMLGIASAFKLMYIAVFLRQCRPVSVRSAASPARASYDSAINGKNGGKDSAA